MADVPEDIPIDIWTYAEAVERVWRDFPPHRAIEHHARAIMAERERAAFIAETHPKYRRGGWSGDPTCHRIAAAIRNSAVATPSETYGPGEKTT